MPIINAMKDAVAVVIKRGETFLLIQRAKKGEAEDYWCPITGAVEPGETQEQAVIREAREEMGIVVDPVEKVWECPTDNNDYLLHWWFVRMKNQDIVPSQDEVKAFEWVTVQQMDQIKKMFEPDRHFFRITGRALPDSSG
jgi:8-oxo-dGTP pyrophosphatase MutT (NUDIX family)